MQSKTLAAVLLLLLGLATGCARTSDLAFVVGSRLDTTAWDVTSAQGSAMSIQHLQMKGSHNSYHLAPRVALSRQWRYTHAPLEVQLSQYGVRQLELDVRYDRGEIVVGHLPLVDGRSSCRLFRDCLKALKRWSRGHRGHLPVFVFIEPKEDLAPSSLEGKLDVLERDIQSVFPRGMLLVPDDVASDPSSLQRSVVRTGWPTLSASQGRFAFALFGPARHLRAHAKGRPALAGRTMFVASEPDRPESAILRIDDPIRDRGLIARAVQSGLLVRTRADERLRFNRARLDAALASGAHFVATDFPAQLATWRGLSGRSPARCNPLSAPAGCKSTNLAELEAPRFLVAASPFF